jgi:hypothetical protein
MATLTGELISETYDSLLKVTDNNTITGVKKRITDGFGNEIPLQLSSTDIEIDGTLILSSLTDLEVATKFLSLKADNSVAYRTAAEVLSDIGGASSSDLSAYVTLATNQTITGVKTFSVDTIINGINIGRGGGNLTSNTRFGNNSLPINTTGVNNTAIGFNVLTSNVIGSSNTAIGHQALPNSNSDNNTAVGLSSLFSLSSGNNNISFGSESGWKISGGADLTIANNSVFLGYATKALANNQTNQIVIGYDATGNGSNTVTIGNSSITNNYFTGNIRGGAFIKSGGLSTEFLKADGSVDSNTYALASSLTGYVTLDTTQTITGTKTFDNPIYLKQRASFIEPPTGYSLISSTDLGFWFANKRAGGGFQSFNLDVTTITNGSVRTYVMPNANGTIALTSDIPSLSGYVTLDTDQTITGAKTLTSLLIGTRANFTSSGSGDTLGINHSSGSGIALYITKGGNGEAIYVNKSSGSGNAVTIVGTLNATTLVKNGGTSSQFLKADGSVDSTSYQPLLSDPVTGIGVTNYVPKFTALSSIGISQIYDNGTNVGINTSSPSFKLDVNGTLRVTGQLTLGSTITNGTYTYTLPSATGTLALTSDLGAYLPLSGGTLTGALTGTSATFSASVIVGTTALLNFGPTTNFVGLSGNNSTGTLSIFAGGTSDRITINGSTGNVGIGTTSPGEILHLQATQPVIRYTKTGVLNWKAGIITGNDYAITVDNVATTAFTIQSGTGNVGIGTTSPSARLQVNRSDSGSNPTAVLRLENTGANYTSKLVLTDGTTNDANISYLGATQSLGFGIGSSLNQMVINPSGNVGIGTTSPGAILHTSVTTNGTSVGALFANPNQAGTADAVSINFGLGRSVDSLLFSIPAIKFGKEQQWTSTGSTVDGYLSFSTMLNESVSERMRITSGGVITIADLAGTGSRAVLADASGNLSAPISDISVKENIQSIGYGLNEIVKMNPVWFDFIDDYKNYGEGRQNGNIAQEMQEIIPEAVFTTPSTGKMGINYDQLHAVYIKAIQELKAQIEELKALINK